jgi:hypothetical protein
LGSGFSSASWANAALAVPNPKQPARSAASTDPNFERVMSLLPALVERTAVLRAACPGGWLSKISSLFPGRKK